MLSWDTASSSDPRADYTVGTVWGHDGSSWLLLDVIRLRLIYPDLLPRVRALREHWNADKILVEKACVGRVLLQDLTRDFRDLNAGRYRSNCAPIAIRPDGSKPERFFTSVERLYSGFARFPRDAPWLDDLKRELMAFPDGRHDDRVDSISQFLNWAVGRGGRSTLQGREARRDGPRPK